MSLTDVQWARTEPLLPDRTPERGGRWRDHRQVIDAIAFKYRTGKPWTDLPGHFGSWKAPTTGCGDGTPTGPGRRSSSPCLPDARHQAVRKSCSGRRTARTCTFSPLSHPGFSLPFGVRTSGVRPRSCRRPPGRGPRRR
ncbi:transposase [Streptomyces sp. NPDC051740]|uniref:transposase n=1 Tax=Streptomyces sp. NPDC051740 TaxID=3365673 RepID=UPI0037B65C08